MELTLKNNFNKYQSDIQSYKDKIPSEVLNNVEQALINYVYLDNLTNSKRKTVWEVSKDSEGKIIVDLTSPHILSDMDYFRKPALTFKQKHKYTEEELQQEYKYFLAQQMAKVLLANGLLSVDEFNKITKRNRQTFSPYLAEIMP